MGTSLFSNAKYNKSIHIHILWQLSCGKSCYTPNFQAFKSAPKRIAIARNKARSDLHSKLCY